MRHLKDSSNSLAAHGVRTFPIERGVFGGAPVQRIFLFILGSALWPTAAGAQNTANLTEHRPRARELGIRPGIYDPGPKNAITDVAGVLVGQVTITQGENVALASRQYCRVGKMSFKTKLQARFSFT